MRTRRFLLSVATAMVVFAAAATRFNRMGLTAPQGQNCSMRQFVSGKCLAAFPRRLAVSGAAWSATSVAGPK